jgi:hypothetical protein
MSTLMAVASPSLRIGSHFERPTRRNPGSAIE